MDDKPENTIPITLFVDKIDFHPHLDRRKKDHVIDVEISKINQEILLKEIQDRKNIPGSMRIRLHGKLVL